MYVLCVCTIVWNKLAQLSEIKCRTIPRQDATLSTRFLTSINSIWTRHPQDLGLQTN